MVNEYMPEKGSSLGTVDEVFADFGDRAGKGDQKENS